MVFELLRQSAEAGELLLVDGGLCRFHIAKNGTLTIYDILVLPEFRRQGIGTKLLETLLLTPGITSIYAKCSVEYDSNTWYQRQGFRFEEKKQLPSGKLVNCWRLTLS